jgi:hypothetical protein
MNERTAKGLGWLLVLVHVLLAVWAVVGLAEMAFAEVPWPRVSNELFPAPVLLAQWLSILVASFFYIAGYLRRWRYTPHAMAFAYAIMATVCAVETFGYMISDTRFLAMALEYLAYALILLFLFKAQAMRRRFARTAASVIS